MVRPVRLCGGFALLFAFGAACSSTDEPDAVQEQHEVLTDHWIDWTQENDCQSQPVADTPLRRLTRTQYTNTVRDLFGFKASVVMSIPPDGRAGPFDANDRSPVNAFHVDRFQIVAEEIAAQAIQNLDELLTCDPSQGASCAGEFIETFGERVLRRPLEDEEKEGLLALYELGSNGGTFAEGIELALTAMLQSPDFLYLVEWKTESGSEPTVPLDGFELASRLSYFLWNSTPDAALLEAARSGALDTASGIHAETERLLGDWRASETIGRFHHEWLALARLDSVSKDPKRFLRFTEEARQAMKRETERFTAYVVQNGDGTLHTLLTAKFSFLEAPLFPIYGMAVPPDHHPGRPVSLIPGQRSGVLTHASFLTSHAYFNETSPILRALTMLENMFCYEVDPPAMEIPDIPEPTPGLSLRDRFEAHTRVEACARCHIYIDPLGFGLENYDAIGQYRTTDQGGVPIDASGVLQLPHDPHIAGDFDGAVELTQRLLRSHRVQDCVPRQWHRFALKRDELPPDVCSVRELQREFVASNYNIRDMIFALVTKDSFRRRPGGAL